MSTIVFFSCFCSMGQEVIVGEDGFLTIEGLVPYDPDDENEAGYSQILNQFSFRLYNSVTGENEDAFFSGYSAVQPIGSLVFADHSETRDALLNLFFRNNATASEMTSDQKAKLLGQIIKTVNSSLEEVSSDEANPSENGPSETYMDNFNRVYLQDEQNFSASFIADVLRYLNADIETENFSSNSSEATERINELVNDRTRGLIPEFLSSPLPAETLVFILNTLYLHGSWPKAMTEIEPAAFTDKSGTLHRVKAINNAAGNINPHILYYKGSSYQAFALPLLTQGAQEEIVNNINNGYSSLTNRRKMFEVLFIRPNNNAEFNRIKENLLSTVEDFDDNVQSHGADEKVLVQIPEFTIRHKLENFKEELFQLSGLPSGSPIYLDNVMIRNNRVEVSKIIQESVFELDNEGIRAAAATGASAIARSINIPPQPIDEIKLDRPFFFFVRHAGSKVVLFQGQIQTVEPMTMAEDARKTATVTVEDNAVNLQFFDQENNPIGEEIEVDASTNVVTVQNPVVLSDLKGENYLVAWEKLRTSSYNRGARRILVANYSPDGDILGEAASLVRVLGNPDALSPHITLAGNGEDFVVSWIEDGTKKSHLIAPGPVGPADIQFVGDKVTVFRDNRINIKYSQLNNREGRREGRIFLGKLTIADRKVFADETFSYAIDSAKIKRTAASEFEEPFSIVNLRDTTPFIISNDSLFLNRSDYTPSQRFENGVQMANYVLKIKATEAGANVISFSKELNLEIAQTYDGPRVTDIDFQIINLNNNAVIASFHPTTEHLRSIIDIHVLRNRLQPLISNKYVPFGALSTNLSTTQDENSRVEFSLTRKSPFFLVENREMDGVSVDGYYLHLDVDALPDHKRYYDIIIRATDRWGFSYEKTFSIGLTNFNSLGTISGLSASPTDDGFILRWNAVPEATSYRVNISEDTDFTTDDSHQNLASNSLEVTGLPAGDYHYRVLAVNNYTHQRTAYSTPGVVTVGEAPTSPAVVNEVVPTVSINEGLTIAAREIFQARVNKLGRRGVTKLIGMDELSVEDVEDNNTTLIFTVTTLPTRGFLEKFIRGTGRTEIRQNDTFTQGDIDNNRIRYTYTGVDDTEDYFEFSVTNSQDGTLTGQTFTITVNDEIPTISTNEGLTLTRGAIGTRIGVSELLAEDAEDDNAGLTYRVSSVPTHGRLENGGTVINADGTFTQADINNNHITYTHTGVNDAEDHFEFSVTDSQGGTLTGQTFTIRVNAPAVVNEIPTVSINEGLTLTRGAIGTRIGVSELSAEDAEDDNAGLTFTLISAPAHGRLENAGTTINANGTFTQADIDNNQIMYTHTGVNDAEDHFEFSVTDSQDGTLTGQTFTITVNAPAVVNEIPTVSINEGLTITDREIFQARVNKLGRRGVTKSIGMDELSAEDVEDNNTTLIFTVTILPTRGVLERSIRDTGNTEIRQNDTFTQGDIDNNRITYTYTGMDDTEDHFEFSVTDSQDGTLTGQTFTITVNAPAVVNEIPTVSINEGLTLTRGAIGTRIGVSELSAEDAEDDNAGLTFTLISAPAHGRLENAGTTINANGTFTQADIDNNQIMYTHTGVDDTEDHFEFSVTDSQRGTLSGQTFTIRVNPEAEDKVLGIPVEEEVAFIYPNPVNDMLHIDIPKELSSSEYEVHILDMNSRLLKSSVHKGGASLQADVRDLAAGVHFIVLKSKENELRHRFVKQ